MAAATSPEKFFPDLQGLCWRGGSLGQRSLRSDSKKAVAVIPHSLVIAMSHHLAREMQKGGTEKYDLPAQDFRPDLVQLSDESVRRSSCFRRALPRLPSGPGFCSSASLHIPTFSSSTIPTTSFHRTFLSTGPPYQLISAFPSSTFLEAFKRHTRAIKCCDWVLALSVIAPAAGERASSSFSHSLEIQQIGPPHYTATSNISVPSGENTLILLPLPKLLILHKDEKHARCHHTYNNYNGFPKYVLATHPLQAC